MDAILVKIVVVLGSGVALVLVLTWYFCDPDDG
jgi:hypothetical protein